MKREGSLLSASLLIAGACIGTGYYGLPVSAGPAGFWPALGMLVIVWLYLFATGLLYLEATLACPDGANVITITKQLIGRTGMVIATLAFVTINYFYLSNFYVLMHDFLDHFFSHWLHLNVPPILFSVALTVIFGGVVVWGTYAADRLNFILFTGLCIAFTATIYLGYHRIEFSHLQTRQWYLIVFAVPMIVTALDYQSLIPTLSSYLKRDRTKLIKTVALALLFPLVFYIAWIWFTMGSVPSADLWTAYEKKHPILEGFLIVRGAVPFQIFFHFTSFFALATSFIATGLAATDFLCDAFKVPVERRAGKTRLWACCGVFIPGFFLSVLARQLAHPFIAYLVGWAEVVFNGAIPIWLAAQLRYMHKIKIPPILPGGKWVLGLLFIATFFLIYLEGVHVLGGV